MGELNSPKPPQHDLTRAVRLSFKKKLRMQNHTEQLDALRAEIQALDAELLALLNRRAALSLRIGRIKKEAGLAVRLPEREQAQLERLCAQNRAFACLPDKDLTAIYKAVLDSSCGLQEALGREKDK